MFHKKYLFLSARFVYIIRALNTGSGFMHFNIIK
jgi:hypothetical protein